MGGVGVLALTTAALLNVFIVRRLVVAFRTRKQAPTGPGS
jgi:hypothetical protein